MSPDKLLRQAGGWFQEGGPDNDIILSSRIRLSRNLTGHLFPGSMGHDEEAAVQNSLVKSFSHLPEENGFHVFPMSKLSFPLRRLLLEKRLISQDFFLDREKILLLRGDMTCSCMINEEDHLKILKYRGGDSLKFLYEDIKSLEDQLEGYVDFAASLEFGYLGPRIDNLGTAMKGTFMVHLPALVKTGLIEKALKSISEAGFTVAGVPDEDDDSLEQYFLVSNTETLGLKEEEILDKLEALIRQVIAYERMAREDLVGKRRWEMEDQIYRAEGIARSCRLLSYKEGKKIISSLRLGAVLRWLDIPLERVGALLILGQKSHISERLNEKTEPEELRINAERARLFREVLFPVIDTGGDSDV